MRNHRYQITLAAVSSVCALVTFSAPALAQNQPRDIACRKAETQPECHARLKCKPSEELEGCLKRLLKCTANEKLEDCERRLLKCRANEGLEDCQKRVRAEPPKEGNAGERDDADRNAAERRDRNTPERENIERRDRDDRETEGGDRRDRDDGARPRRQRVHRDGERERRGRSSGTRGFQANKTFGLGLEVGEPVGLNGKYFLSGSGALDFGIGANYGHYYYGNGLHIYGDYLWHPISLVSASAFELPFYIGGGLRFWDFRYCYQQVCDYGGSAIGIRIPFGISFDFNNVPLDIFIQFVPVIDFVYGDYYDRFRDRGHLGIDLSAGIRYWFK